MFSGHLIETKKGYQLASISINNKGNNEANIKSLRIIFINSSIDNIDSTKPKSKIFYRISKNTLKFNHELPSNKTIEIGNGLTFPLDYYCFLENPNLNLLIEIAYSNEYENEFKKYPLNLKYK